jgi:hypothetical protein
VSAAEHYAHQMARIAEYAHRKAIEHAARKHGHLGPLYRTALVRRLIAVDVDRDGATLDAAQAHHLVERWHDEGETKRAGDVTATNERRAA